MTTPQGQGIAHFDGGRRGQQAVSSYTGAQIRALQRKLAEYALDQPEETREQWLAQMLSMVGVWVHPTDRGSYRLIHSGGQDATT